MMSPCSSSETERTRERARVVRVVMDDRPRWGIPEDGRVCSLEGDPFGEWHSGRILGRAEELSFLAPVAPTKIICVGLNYPSHADESSTEVPAEPLLFFKPPSAVIGPDATILLPSQSERVDYEAELVVVIGRRCRSARPEQAWGYVLGVTCGNDVTARDLQRLDDQWTRAKGFDTFCPLGPSLVIGVSEDDVAEMTITCRVNDQLRQSARASEMAFSPAELIAYASSIMTLEPGDVIMTGTPAGVGPLTAGDEVAVQIEGVGTLRNGVVAAG